MNKPVIITIDGPAGAGKSTIARLLAQRLSFHYLDTGALYRATTLKALQRNIPFSAKRKIASLVASSKIEVIYPKESPNSGLAKIGEQEIILLDGKDVTEEIRTPRLSMYVSKLSASPLIRQALVRLQKRLARGKNIICEGRDMGSVVFKQAQIKFYLDASIKERAQRRYRESVQRFPAKQVTYHQVYQDISVRDYQDTHRKTAPLVRPTNSFLVDTTKLSISQVVSALMKIVAKRLGKK
jgi:CMP/dCMP kinase